jgi:hypothetical protein
VNSPAEPVSAMTGLDESGSNHRPDPSTYILDATVCLTEEADAVRERVRSLRLPAQRTLNWRDEDHPRRGEFATVISELSPHEPEGRSARSGPSV